MNTLSAAVDNVFLESGTLVFQGEYSDSGFWDAVPQGQGMVAGNGWVAACGRRNNLYVNLRVELRAGEGADARSRTGRRPRPRSSWGTRSCSPTPGVAWEQPGPWSPDSTGLR